MNWQDKVLRFPVHNVAKFDQDLISKSLNGWVAEGWKLVTTDTISRTDGTTLYFVATLKKPADA